MPVKIEPIDFHELIKQITAIMKRTRAGNNALTNCGYLTEYALEILNSILAGETPQERIVTTEESGAVTYTNVAKKQTIIKIENAQILVRDQYVTSNPVRNENGLYAKLPPQTATMMDVDNDTETLTIELDGKTIPRKNVMSPHELNHALKALAKSKGGEGKIVYGDVHLARLNSPIGHVITYVASAETVFYIDAQKYNGLTDTGNPILFDISEAYPFLRDINKQHDINAFQPICFYLEYGCVTRKIQRELPMPDQNDSSAPVTQMHRTAQTISISKHSAPTQTTFFKITAQTNPLHIMSIPQSIPIVTLQGNVTPQAVSVIPAHIMQIYITDAEVTPQAVQAIKYSIRIGLAYNVNPETVRAIPSCVKMISIHEGISPDAIKAIPPHVEAVKVKSNAPVEILALIPGHVNVYTNNGLIRDGEASTKKRAREQATDNHILKLQKLITEKDEKIKQQHNHIRYQQQIIESKQEEIMEQRQQMISSRLFSTNPVSFPNNNTQQRFAMTTLNVQHSPPRQKF